MNLLSLFVLLLTSISTSAEPSTATLDLAEMRDEIRDELVLATPAPLRLDYRVGRALLGRPAFGCDELAIQAGVYLTRDAIWVGLSVGDRRQIENIDGEYDWDSLKEALVEYKALPFMDYRYDYQLAAEETITADVIARALHVGREAGLADPVYTLPSWAAVSFEDDSIDYQFPLRAVNRHSVAVHVLDDGVRLTNDDGTVEFVRKRGRRDDLQAVAAELRHLRRSARRAGRSSSHAHVMNMSPSDDGGRAFVVQGVALDEDYDLSFGFGYRIEVP